MDFWGRGEDNYQSEQMRRRAEAEAEAMFLAGRVGDMSGIVGPSGRWVLARTGSTTSA